jgi:hypothetical protein
VFFHFDLFAVALPTIYSTFGDGSIFGKRSQVQKFRVQPSRRPKKDGRSNRKRNSKKAVRCLIQAIEAASLITKKPCQFGVVSYKGSKVLGFKVRRSSCDRAEP